MSETNFVYKECKECWAYIESRTYVQTCVLWKLIDYNSIKKCPCSNCITKMVCYKQCQERISFWNFVKPSLAEVSAAEFSPRSLRVFST